MSGSSSQNHGPTRPVETRAGVPALQGGRFGTFGGVFTPCTLTILGVIMFLRFDQVVGEAGVWRALLIVAAAKAITTLTALSLSAIATNTRVRGGGAYFLISRSLGIEFGGAIGLVFFLSQAVSTAMYVIGFTEAFLAVWPVGDPRSVGSLVNAAVFACVYIGAGWTIKIQYGILAVLALSIVSFVIGAIGGFSSETLSANWGSAFPDGSGFWVMFALFFPAATGIMAGANMSGDLADPARAIPRGTLLAIVVTGLVYAAFAMLLGGAGQRGDMLDPHVMTVGELAWWQPAIIAGVFAATLSSALGSMMGAPRILQALARDRVFPILNPFEQGSGDAGEPRRATVLSFVIAQLGVLLGDLNAIAPIITMFFMITYGALNLATFTEAYSRNPSWRPRFKAIHWSTSLLGGLACLATMVLINPLWAGISIALMFGLHRYLARQDLEATWGDVNSGAAFERARRNLLTLEQERYHPKNWRPSVLALGMASKERLRHAAFARWLAGRHGLLVFGQVLVGDAENYLEKHAARQRQIRKIADDHGIEAFPAVMVASSLGEGVGALIQCSGIGALRPNLVMLGWSSDPERRGIFAANLRRAERLGRSVAVLRLREGEDAPDDPWWVPRGPIDVWWLGQSNGELMILLAHLLQTNQGWRARPIRLRRMLKSEQGRDEALKHLQGLLAAARIEAQADVVIGDDFAEVLAARSRRAALTVLGFRTPDEANQDAVLDALDRISAPLPRVLLVHSAGDMGLQE